MKPLSEQLSDLAGKSICFYQGDNAHLNLETAMAARRLDFVRMGYMEYGELHDAYNSGVCEAQVGESGDLAAARLEEHSAPASRILTEPLGAFPVFAATPGSDPQWSAIVAWAIYALERAELPATAWTAAGLKSLAVEGRDLGSVVTDAIAAVKRDVKVPEGNYLVWGGEFGRQPTAEYGGRDRQRLPALAGACRALRLRRGRCDRRSRLI